AAIIADPKYPFSYYQRARTEEDAGSYDKALADLDVALGNDPLDPNQVKLERGVVLEDMGHVDEAIKIYSNILESDADNAVARTYRAFDEYQKHDYESAMKDCDLAISGAPTYERAYRTRANIESAQNNDDRALLDLNEALRLDQDDSDALISRG